MKEIKIKSVINAVIEVCSQYGFCFQRVNCFTSNGKKSYHVVFNDINRNSHSLQVPIDGRDLKASDSDIFASHLDWLFCHLGCIRTRGLAVYAENVAKIINLLCVKYDLCYKLSDDNTQTDDARKICRGMALGFGDVIGELKRGYFNITDES